MSISRSARTLAVSVALVAVAAGAIVLTIGQVYAPDENAGQPARMPTLFTQLWQLKAAGEEGADARRQLAEEVYEQYLSDGESATELSLAEWHALAETLGPDMPAEARAAWCDGLHTAFADAEWSVNQLGSFQWMLNLLGDDAQNDFAATWVQSQGCWQQWPIDDILALGKCLGYGWNAGENVSAARRLVGQDMLATTLADPAEAAAVAPKTWEEMVSFYAAAMSPEERTAWRDALKNAYAPNWDYYRALDCRTAGGAALAVVEVGVRAQSEQGPTEAALDETLAALSRGRQMAHEWFKDRSAAELAGANVQDLARFTYVASYRDDFPDYENLLPQLEPTWLAQQAAGQLDVDGYHSAVRMCVVAGNEQAALKWARMAVDAFIGSEAAMEDVAPEVLKGLNSLLRQVGFDTMGQACPQFARALAVKAATDGLDGVASDFPVYVHGAMFSAECRDILAGALVGPAGRLNQAIAGTLGQSYNESGELEQWLAYADARAAEASSAGQAELADDWAAAGEYAEALRRYESPRE
jgi:hypothetical protein